jgi:DNA-binding NarL/FixJ family response regulator
MLRKRITIIDSDEDFCMAVSAIIKNSDKFQLNKVYHDSKEALKKIQDDYSEILIMDLDFAELKGTDFIVKAREKIPGLNILIVTNYDDDEIVFHSITNGASGYLLKKRCLPHLLEALTIISNGGSPLDPIIARYIIRSMQVSGGSPLSTRESMVLKLLVQGKTYSTIGKDLLISGETAKTHIKNIYKKLKVNSKAEAVRKAVEDQLIVSHLGFYYQ